MVVKSITDEQLNYYKFSTLVVDEFPKALRHTFKHMWDNFRPGSGPIWDDSEVVRNLFLAMEGSNTKVPTNESYEEWDCTALFQATIYAKVFSSSDSKGNLKTLSEVYVKPRGFMPKGSFHTFVLSPVGNDEETFAIAIDQLRLLRNSICHTVTSKMDKTTFDQYIELARNAFKALGVETDSFDVVRSWDESHFPTEEVARLKRNICLMAVCTGVLFD